MRLEYELDVEVIFPRRRYVVNAARAAKSTDASRKQRLIYVSVRDIGATTRAPQPIETCVGQLCEF